MEDEESNDSSSESVGDAPELESDSSEDGSDDADGSDVETDQDEEVDPELRKRIAEALQMESVLEDASDGDSQGKDSDDDDSDESDIEMMDDDQMMALDDKLAEIFRSSRAASKNSKGGERTPTSKGIPEMLIFSVIQGLSDRRHSSRLALWTSSRPS